MKYTCSIEINLPIDKVVELWKDKNNLKEWQDGFVSRKHISGDPDKPGAKSELIYQQGKRKIELVETIITNNLPHEKKALYEHIHMTNIHTTRFKSLENNKIQYISEVKYTKFNGIMPTLMAKLFP